MLLPADSQSLYFLRFPAVSPSVEAVAQAKEYGQFLSAEHAYSLAKTEQFFLFFSAPDLMCSNYDNANH